MSSYMKKSMVFGIGLYMNRWGGGGGGGVFKRFSHFFNCEKITVCLLMRSAIN